MILDLSKIQFISELDSFKNYNVTPTTFSFVIPSQNLAASGSGTPVTFGSGSTPLNNSNAVSRIKVQYSGVESTWRVVQGTITTEYPDWTTPTYQIVTIVFFTGGNLFVSTYVINETAGTITIPNITVNVSAALFLAPF